MGNDRDRIPDRSTAAAVAELVGRRGEEEAHGRGVRYVYAAEYGCATGNGKVGVTAVMFSEPVDAARAARFRSSPMGILFKGQLAAIVWTSGQGCEDCYRTLYERAERIVGREQ
jgi:hypothetical protein